MAQHTVYSTPTCVQCKLTYKVLDEHGVPYRVIDVSEDEEALKFIKEELGYSAAPVVVTADGRHWTGFRPDLLMGLNPHDAPPAR